ncbi:Dynamin-like GTPase that mediates homotypic ER fusion [Clydaea vesicula]|uniref:Dynamin-like GTPase that mediates homotypic ER fusion n=1 Tax=Clydaea vesicula TaxID=447962 RepID=A0AAD5Y2D6_9FUNG|nr:Dynamin-like GTPase that mediates homotypic ER fusion [Clydaea vesicula]
MAQVVPDMLLNGSDHADETHIEDTRLQILNEHQEFSTQLPYYMKHKWNILSEGFNYHLVAVFGSQSTGKSTLLNKLFGTRFDVMSEKNRQQTTKGLWISKANDFNVLVMDVEGTDGRERGENQDFERKSALFSLATAEVILINMWENMVGLYNGANMGLLKTVFEVNLQLFQKDGDFTGQTPLNALSQTLKADLEKIWAGLNKPKGRENSNISDFFDFSFSALPHKIFAAPMFDKAVELMRERFTKTEDSGYVFLEQYKKNIPADGFPKFAESIWEKIISEKDLDIPTQQQLLAQFRCDEIARLDSGKVIEKLGKIMDDIKSECLDSKLKDVDWSSEDFVNQFLEDVEEITEKRKVEAMEKMVKSLQKFVRESISDPVQVYLNESEDNMWQNVFYVYKTTVEKSTANLTNRSKAFEVGEEEIASAVLSMKRDAWELLLKVLTEGTSEAEMVSKLKRAFDRKFKYDDDEVPRMWNVGDDIDKVFNEAKLEAEKVLRLFVKFDVDFDQFAGIGEEFIDEHALVLLSPLKVQKIKGKFAREADTSFIEAKRSLAPTIAKIPTWFVALTVVLGWNEFMAILYNPVYFVSLALFLVGGFIVYKLGLAGPLFSVARVATGEVTRQVGAQIGKSGVSIDNLTQKFNDISAKSTENLRKSKHDYRKTFKSPFFYPNNSQEIPYFDTTGGVIKTEQSIRLTPSVPNMKGSIWAKEPNTHKNWEIEFSFTAFGRGYMGGKGLAFWYTKDRMIEGPIYGGKDLWTGFGLFFDTSNQEDQRFTPIIYGITKLFFLILKLILKKGVLNDGRKEIEHAKDIPTFSLGTCFRDYRNTAGHVWVRVIYHNSILKVEVDARQEGYSYTSCFESKNILLPTGYYFGMSASTDHLADDHDILSFDAYEYEPEEKKANPSRPYEPEHIKKEGEFHLDKNAKEKIKKVEGYSHNRGSNEFPDTINSHTIQQLQENQFKIIEALNLVHSKLDIPKVGHENNVGVPHDAAKSHEVQTLRQDLGELTKHVQELTNIVHEAFNQLIKTDTNDGAHLNNFVQDHMKVLHAKLDENHEETKKVVDNIKSTNNGGHYTLYVVFFLIGVIVMQVVRTLRKGGKEKKYI